MQEKTRYSGTDVTGAKYDFVIRAFPGEPSARKFIVPFRADLVEKWDIKKGDLVTGRPAGPGCPVYHALRVLSANPVTGVLECHTVGPLAARKEKAHDVQAYHVHAFEGIAETILRPPTLGLRQRFLPGLLHDGPLPHCGREHGPKEERRGPRQGRRYPDNVRHS